MAPVVMYLRQLWAEHRWPLLAVGLLLLANVAQVLYLQYSLVPTVSQREQLLIRRQAEMSAGGTLGGSPLQQYVQGEKDLAEYRKHIPPYREFSRLILELQNLADEAGLELSKISYRYQQDSVSQELLYEVPLSLTGSYRDVKQFIHTLEQSPRLIIIEKIGLDGVDEEGVTNVRLQLGLKTLFRTEKS